MSTMRRWSIFTALAVIVVLAAGWLLLVKPQKSKITNYQDQATTQEQQNAQIATQIAALQAEQKELPQQQLALQKFSTQVPNDAEEPTLIRQFSSAAHGSGVDLSSITPGAPVAVASTTPTGTQTLGAASTPAGTLDSLTVTLAVTGSYPNVESFFEALERLPRAVLVTGFSLAPGAVTASGTNTLTVSVSTQVFFTPPAAAPAAGTVPQTLTPGTAPTTAPTTAATPGAAASTAAVATQAAGETS